MEVDMIKYLVIQLSTQKCTVYTATQVCKMLHTVVQYITSIIPNSCVQNDYLDNTAKLINIYIYTLIN